MRPLDILHPWLTSWPTWLTAAIVAALLRRLLGRVMPRRRRPAYAWRIIATATRIIALAGTAATLASLCILTSSHLPPTPIPELNLHP
jgi:hypothetical protein